MNADHLNAFRDRLESEIAECKEHIAQLEIDAAPVPPDSSLGRLTRMESLNDQGVSKAALLQAQERLYQLTQALAQVDTPGFGSCRLCRQPIPLERLLAIPESTRCVRCAMAG